MGTACSTSATSRMSITVHEEKKQLSVKIESSGIAVTAIAICRGRPKAKCISGTGRFASLCSTNLSVRES